MIGSCGKCCKGTEKEAEMGVFRQSGQGGCL